MPRERINGIDINYFLPRFFDSAQDDGAAGAKPPLLMLHGFTGSINAWQGIPEKLGESFRVIVVDMIGHGETSAPDDPDRYGIEHAVDDLLMLLDRLEIEQTALLGYSMGGRVAMHLALAAPARITRLVLESAAPGINDSDERQKRVASDERLARMIEEQGIEAFVDYWESIPLFASQRSLPETVRQNQRAIRTGQRVTGLANSLRGMGAGAMEPVIGRLGELDMPVLYLAGEYDEKYRKIGQQMTTQMQDARYVEISGAGHTIHLEQRGAYVQVMGKFLCDDDQMLR